MIKYSKLWKLHSGRSTFLLDGPFSTLMKLRGSPIPLLSRIYLCIWQAHSEKRCTQRYRKFLIFWIQKIPPRWGACCASMSPISVLRHELALYESNGHRGCRQGFRLPNQLKAGGEPSAWSPPGGLAERPVEKNKNAKMWRRRISMTREYMFSCNLFSGHLKMLIVRNWR